MSDSSGMPQFNIVHLYMAENLFQMTSAGPQFQTQEIQVFKSCESTALI